LFAKHDKDFAFFKVVVVSIVSILQRLGHEQEMLMLAIKSMSLVFAMNRDSVLAFIEAGKPVVLEGATEILKQT
jgi:hypothetical protein